MGDFRPSNLAEARRLAQPVLRLGWKAVSPEAKALVSHCLEVLILPSLPSQRPSSVAGIKRAAEGTLGGLVEATGLQWGDGWLRRPLSNNAFTDEPVSRVQFRKVLDALSTSGLVEIAQGFLDRQSSRAVSTRLRLSEAGRNLVVEYGVTIGNSGSHFARTDS